MSIVYALVARSKTVLAEYTSSSGNFPQVTRVLLTKIPTVDCKRSFKYDDFTFHCIIDEGITFMCMTDGVMKTSLTYAFLEDVKGTWRQRYREVEQTAMAFGMNSTFEVDLMKKMAFYNSNPKADKIGRVQTQIDTVKEVMVENIDKLLEREEKLDLLVVKTQKLASESNHFRRKTRQLKYAMIYNRIKYYLIGVFTLALIIFILTWIACGLNFERCK